MKIYAKNNAGESRFIKIRVYMRINKSNIKIQFIYFFVWCFKQNTFGLVLYFYSTCDKT